MEIVYCERCGIRVPEKDLEENRATRDDKGVICSQCNKVQAVKPAGGGRSSGANLLPGAAKAERRSEVNLKPPQRGTSHAVLQPAVRSASVVPRPASTQQTQWLIMGVVAALLVVVGLLLALRDSGQSTEARPAPSPVPPPLALPPVHPPTLPSPAPVVPDIPAPVVPPNPEVAPEPPSPTKADPAPATSQPELQPVQAEDLARAAFEELLRYEGLEAADKASRLARIDAFLEKHGAALVAARARTLRDELLVVKPATATGATERSALPPMDLGPCHWIWTAEAQPPAAVTRYFRAKFTIPEGRRVRTARLLFSADNVPVLYLNGQLVFEGPNDFEWQSFCLMDVASCLVSGENLIAFSVGNISSAAALIARLRVDLDNGEIITLETGKHWRAADQSAKDWTSVKFDDSGWVPATEVFAFGQSYKVDGYPAKPTFQAHGPGLVLAVTPPQSAPQAQATFIRRDETTGPHWQGAYGSHGYRFMAMRSVKRGITVAGVQDELKLPGYVADFVKHGTSSHSWVTPPDPLTIKPPVGEPACYAADFGEPEFTYDISLKQAQSLWLTMYCVDPDKVRSQTVELLDGNSGQLLDRQELTKLTQGVYLVWQCTGQRFKVRFVKQAGHNAVCSAVFFDAAVPMERNAQLDTVLDESEAMLKASRWKEASEKIAEAMQTLAGKGVHPEQQARLNGLLNRGKVEHVNSLLRGERVKLAGSRKQLPDGRWEFSYDFMNPAQRQDFIYPAGRLLGLERGECHLAGLELLHLLSFEGDVEVSYEAATVGTPAKCIRLRLYDWRGEFGGKENKSTLIWRLDEPAMYEKPLAEHTGVEITPGKWHKIEQQYEHKTKTLFTRIDGKEALKFGDPRSSGQGTVGLGSSYSAKFRNLRIRGLPTAVSIEKLEKIFRFVPDLGRRIASGQPVTLLADADQPYWNGSWEIKNQEASGKGTFWLHGLAMTHYDLTCELRLLDGEHLALTMRANGTHSWQVVFQTGRIEARQWDLTQSKEARSYKNLTADISNFHKLYVQSRGKNLKLVLDDKEVLLDIRDVPLDAVGFFWSTWKGTGAVRKTTVRFCP